MMNFVNDLNVKELFCYKCKVRRPIQHYYRMLECGVKAPVFSCEVCDEIIGIDAEAIGQLVTDMDLKNKVVASAKINPENN